MGCVCVTLGKTTSSHRYLLIKDLFFSIKNKLINIDNFFQMCQPLSLVDKKRYALNPVIYEEAVLVVCQEEVV